LAFIESGNLYIYDLATQTKKIAFQAASPSSVVGTPVWSPDNVHLVITVSDNVKNPTSPSSLYLIKLGTEPQRIQVSGLVGTCEKEPQWSPDGKTIAFTEVLDPDRKNVFADVNDREVWLVNADGQNPRKLADGKQPAWSSDSSSLLYVTNGTIDSINGSSLRQNNAIHLLKLGSTANTDREVLATSKVPSDLNKYGYPFDPSTFYLQYPVFLNNDKTIAFTTLGHGGLVITVASSGGNFKLWDTNYEGGFGATYPDPTNGSQLMYESYPASGVSHVNIVDTNTTSLPTRVNKVQFGGEKIKEAVSNPTWSPDTSQIAYVYSTNLDNSTTNIKTVAIASSQATKPQSLFKGVISGLAWSN
jgi:Tol biopolymer transport system component